MKIKDEIVHLISEKLNENPYASLEHFALFILQQKISNNSATAEERQVLINDFLSNYLEFDPETDEPIGRTNEIEKMIDFLIG